MVTVKVVDRTTGQPVSGARVSLYVSCGILLGGVTDAEYTDDSGEASFDYDSASIVYVNGDEAKRGSFRGLVVVNI